MAEEPNLEPPFAPDTPIHETAAIAAQLGSVFGSFALQNHQILEAEDPVVIARLAGDLFEGLVDTLEVQVKTTNHIALFSEIIQWSTIQAKEVFQAHPLGIREIDLRAVGRLARFFEDAAAHFSKAPVPNQARAKSEMPQSNLGQEQVVSGELILSILADQGIPSDEVTYTELEQALRDYRESHPDATFARELENMLVYSDFGLRNRALFHEQWNNAKLPAVNPGQWHDLAGQFEELSAREAEKVRSGECKEPLAFYGNHLDCRWSPNRDDELSVRFDVLAAIAGQRLGASPGVQQAIRRTKASSWAEFWKYCLWFFLEETSHTIKNPFRVSVRFCLHLALHSESDDAGIHRTTRHIEEKGSQPGMPTGVSEQPRDLARRNDPGDTQRSQELSPVPQRRPDLDLSRERLALVETLSRELALLKTDLKGYCTVDSLKRKHPTLTLWTIIADAQIKELVDGEEFTPKIYAKTLTLIKFGITSRETLKKDRKKLRKAGGADKQ